MPVKNDFAEWAKQYSGCDGGNLDGPVWFCGIEYGGGYNDNNIVFNDESCPCAWEDNEKSRDDLISKRGMTYNISLIKLYAALLGREVSQYRTVATEKAIFSKHSDTFKLNLYPIASPRDNDDLWAKWLYDKTGFPTKSMYRGWCQSNRFPELMSWTAKHSPRLIISTGQSHKSDFFLAFGGVEKLYDNSERIEAFEAAQQKRKMNWTLVNDGKTALIVIPFPSGQHGLNSDALLTECGRKINDICTTEFGANWMIKNEMRSQLPL